jgi:hypothetical protein
MSSTRSTRSEDRIEPGRVRERLAPGTLIELDSKYIDTIVFRRHVFSSSTATLDGEGRSFEEIAAGREGAAAAQ